MPPKFQSSFIPRGPAPSAAVSGVIPQARRPARQYDLLAFVAKLVFGLSILGAAGVVGYQWYLNRSIAAMGAQLEAMRAEVTSGLTIDLIRLNDRIVSVDALVKGHEVLSPFFSLLAASTPKSVQFTYMNFVDDKEGLKVTMGGAAKSYAALALIADTFDKSAYLRQPVFSDIRLDDKGNVSFSASALLSPDLVSYTKTVVRANQPPAAPLSATSTATTTATTTPR
jgi:hypothetical protein